MTGHRDGAAEERVRVLRTAAELAWHCVHAAMAAGEPFEVEFKSGPADLVTPVDRAVEARVRDLVLASFPDDAFQGEEFGAVNDGAEWTWWVDPVDGTTNFANRVPFASTSIAVARGGVTVAGVVVDAASGARLVAVRGRGSERDGRPLRLDDERGLAGAVVATELMGARPWPGLERVIDRLAAEGATMRVLGSSAMSLALTAAGVAVACVIASAHPIDTAAGLLLVEEAGGTVARLEAHAFRPVPMLVAGTAAAVEAVSALLGA